MGTNLFLKKKKRWAQISQKLGTSGASQLDVTDSN